MARQDGSEQVPSHATPRATGGEQAHGRRDRWTRIKHFWTSTTGIAVTAVTVVGGIVAIVVAVSGWLAPSPALTVSFDRLKVDDNVSLAEFNYLAEAREVAQARGSAGRSPTALTVPYRLARAVAGARSSEVARVPATVAGTSTEDTSTADTATEAPATEPVTTSTTQDTTTTSTGSINSKLAIPLSTAHFTPVNGVPTREGTGAASQQVQRVAAALTRMNLPRRSEKLALPRKCVVATCPATTPLIDDLLTYHPDPAVAARDVADAFADSRGRVIDHEFHPIGAAVSYTIDLAGFAHNEAILVWSLWPAGGERPLGKSWLRNVIAKEVTPLRENETFSGLFWVPLPPRRGEYEVHLTLYTSNHVEHGEMETEPPFH
jgi:hypothetical protein